MEYEDPSKHKIEGTLGIVVMMSRNLHQALEAGRKAAFAEVPH
jgi:hypothetical protein